MPKLRFPALALLFAAALMPVLFFLLPARGYSPKERRYLAERPEVTLESLAGGELGEALEGYLSDHFPGRDFFVGVGAYWELLTGRNTARAVYHCKDGYLIAAPETAGTGQLQTNLERFDRFAEKTGLPAALFLIPTAGDILPEVLPARHAPYRYAECAALAQEVCANLEVLPLGEALSAAREEQIYYKTDHHLTSAGCYAAYSAFCRAKGREPLPRSAYTVTACEGFRGSSWASSGYWLARPETLELWDAGQPLRVTIQDFDKEDISAESVFFTENLASDDWYTVFLDGNHPLVRIENPGAQGGKLLLVRDSYAHCLAPFLAADYQEVVLVDLRFYRLSVSELIGRFGITELGFVYGVDSLLTDTNSAWLD